MKITVHGLTSYEISKEEFFKLISRDPCGADELIVIDVDGLQKTLKEWHEGFYEINYIEGDMFADVANVVKSCNVIVPHVCNNQGGWGAGFVIPLGKNYPNAKAQYLHLDAYTLGETQFVENKVGDNNVVICNMIAQTLGGSRPLYYNHLAKCMDAVADYALRNDIIQIMAPAFGSGLAGGDWDVIKELINDCWLEKRLFVDIYYLKGTFTPPFNSKKLNQ